MSPNTERFYRIILNANHMLAGDVDRLPELAQLRELIESAAPPKVSAAQVSSVECWREPIAKMLLMGAQPKAIYDKLRLEESSFVASLSAVKRMCASIRERQGPLPEEVDLIVETGPGEIAQVDFGSIGTYFDPERKQLRKAYVFVMTLAFSRHMVARIVFDQSAATWMRLHEEAFRELGGIPSTIVPDNLKAAVVKAVFGVGEGKELHRGYVELARHYGFKIDPTPPYSPEKKGKVEASVKYIKHNFLAPRRDQRLVDTLRLELQRWLREIASTRIHATTRKQPIELFECIEKARLLPLPQRPFEQVTWYKSLARTDSHVVVEQARYSVPFRWIGKVILARCSRESVTLMYDDVRIATHPRQPIGKVSTLAEHLPEHRRDYCHRDRKYWETRARMLGDEVFAFVVALLDKDKVVCHLHSAQACVKLLESVPTDRAQAACRRANFYGSYSYRALKNILEKQLDMEPLPIVTLVAKAAHERPRFARHISELLGTAAEVIDASH
jgi:transposase